MSALLDNRSLLLMAGGLYLLVPLITWLVLRMPRERPALLWCGGGMLAGLGLVLIGLRGQIHDVWSYGLGPPFWAVGALLVAQSLRCDLGRGWRLSWIALLGLVYSAVLLAVLPWAPTPGLSILVRGVNLTVLVLLVHSAWQVGQAEGSRHAYTIAAAYGLQAVGALINLSTAIMAWSDSQTLQGGGVQVSVSLVTLLVALIAGMAYLGLALERTEKRHLDTTRDMARARQWQTHRQALVTLDRERTLSVLADSLGHAMMQPLTAALVRVQLAQRQLALPAPQTDVLRDWIAQVAQDIQRTAKTVEQVRQWVRPLPSQNGRIDLREVWRDVERLLLQQAVNEGVSMRFERLDEPVWVQGDALQLSQALLQVARNALAALAQLPPGSPRRLKVQLEKQPQLVLIHVQDTGPGLPQGLLQSGAWHPTQRPQSLQGIGLFVVQSVLAQHQGALLLDNLPSGGAQVSLALPWHPDPTPMHA